MALPVARAFSDRYAAGEALARALAGYAGRRDVVVLGMPRGGVAVAKPVAHALGAPLDIIIARKLGVPGISEVALGAIAEGSDRVVPDKVGWYIGVPSSVTRAIADKERIELQRRVALFRGGSAMPQLRGRTVIIVDDGFATGATLRAAAEAVRRMHPDRIVAAVPVGSPSHCDDVRAAVDELIVLQTPEPFDTVSAHYDDFSQVSDGEVLQLVGRRSSAAEPEAGPEMNERTVSVPLGSTTNDALGADLGIPNGSQVHGLVLFAHGGGSSRHSYRNRYLAGRLRMAGWATLRLDLLLEREVEEDEQGDVRFDVARIGRRLRLAVEWAASERVAGSHRIVLFGASTGAAAAAMTAITRGDLVSGVISRGGRVDLVGPVLAEIRCPVLMIVGSEDHDTLRLNRTALTAMPGQSRLQVIRRAGHTFEEPGTLGAVGEAAVDWLAPRRSRVERWLEQRGWVNRSAGF